MARSYHVFKDRRGVEPFKRIDPANGQNVNRRFRFNISAGLRFEDEVGCGINDLIKKGRTTSALINGVYYGFLWEDPKLTVDQVSGQVQVFIDGGGDVTDLYGQMIDAINDQGTFGRKAEAPADPLAAGADGEAGSASASTSSSPEVPATP